MSIEVISGFIGLILTLLVFSYLIGDNPLFRFAIYLFIGVSSGYAAFAAWQYVLWPKLFSPFLLQFGNITITQLILLAVPLVLSLSLLAKLSPRTSSMGNFAMAVLVGVGAATAVGGALMGTLVPQAAAAMNEFDIGSVTGAAILTRLVQATIMFFGTIPQELTVYGPAPVADELIESAVCYFLDNPKSKINKVYFLAYTEQDLQICLSKLDRDSRLKALKPTSRTSSVKPSAKPKRVVVTLKRKRG